MNLPTPSGLITGAGATRAGRIVLAAGAALTVLMFGAVALLLWYSRQESILEWKTALGNSALTLAEHARQSMTSADLVLRSITERVNDAGIDDDATLRREMGSRAIFDMLKDKASGVPQIDVATIVARNGDVINFTRSYPPPAINLSDRDYFKAHFDDPSLDVYLSAPVPNRGTGRPTFYLTRKIKGKSGQTLGLVLTGIETAFFENFYEAVSIGAESSIALFRSDGLLLTRFPRRDDLLGKSFRDQASFRLILNASASGAIVTSDPSLSSNGEKVQRIIAARMIKDYPLAIRTAATENLFLARWRSTALLIAIGTSILSATLLLLTLIIARLLTRQIQAAAKIQTAEATLGHAIDGVQEGIVLWGPDDRLQLWNRHYVDINRAVADLLVVGLRYEDFLRAGFSRGQYENVGADVDTWIDERMTERSTGTSWQRTLLIGGRWIRSFDQRTPDGGIIGIRSDVTDLKNREVELIAAQQEAAAAMAAKSEFLAMMSHEIRTPMNAVIGMSSLLADTDLDQTQRRYAKTIEDSASHLLTIINDILDFSRLEAGRMQIETGAFDLREVIDSVLDIVRGLPGAQRLRIDASIDARVPQKIIGDAGRLNQILLNLISNAVKFTNNGSVTISADPVIDPAGALRIRFAVRDTGIGIATADQQRLFQPFEQVGAAANRLKGGTGLGLAICKRLVDLMDGSIGIESAVGSGSTFWFELPFGIGVADAASADTPARSVRSATQPLRILVAEDTPANQIVARAMLEKLGHRVQIVGNGEEAVMAAQAGAFDLVLMDLQMPLLDGYGATRRLRELGPPTAGLPIVALTAFAQASDRDRALSAGMTDFLTKPFRPRDLAGMIDRLFGEVQSPVAPSPAQLPSDMPATVDDAGQINEPALHELHQSVGDVFPQLVESFINDVDAAVMALRSAAETGDSATFRRSAHSLKGMFRQFGAAAAGAIAAEIEQAGLSTPPETLDRLAQAARAATQRVRDVAARSLIAA